MTAASGSLLAGVPFPFSAAAGAILAGPLLMISIGLLGVALRTPEIDLPFEDMLGSRGTVVLLGTFVVILGPVCEELAFRGFLMPLLIRSARGGGRHCDHRRPLRKHAWL